MEITVEQKLHAIENTIIGRMAKKTGMTFYGMKRAISECAELKAYYKKVRDQVIRETYGVQA